MEQTAANQQSLEIYAIINSRVCIVEPVNIGTDAVIVAGSVVTKDIELFVIVGGSPAKKIETK